jgi:hypothetical protein
LVGALAGLLVADALVLDIDDDQSQQVDHGVVAREVATALVTLRIR